MNRYVILGLAAAFAFVMVAAMLAYVMPKPLRPVDSMMIGGIATLAALAVIFVGVMATLKQGDVFFKRRKKD